jgi:hypothetical protein
MKWALQQLVSACKLNPDGVGALRAQIDHFWSRALTTYKEVAEQQKKQPAKRKSYEN